MRYLLHVHTSCSQDSILDKYLLLLMCCLYHIDCVAITDHNELRHALAWQGFFARHGVRIIPGEEVFTAEGEIIGLFLSQRIPAGLTPEQTVSEIRRQGGVVYVPHPFDQKRHRSVLRPEALQRIQQDVDCIEIHNGRNVEAWYDARQQAVCERVGALPVVGEDAHCFFEVGRNIIEMPSSQDTASFLQALRSPEVVFQRRPCIGLAHRVTKFVRLGKMIAKGDVHGIQRILYRRLGSGKPQAG